MAGLEVKHDAHLTARAAMHAREIAAAHHAERITDGNGRPLRDDCCLDPFARDNAAAIVEQAVERACIEAADRPLPGLVSTPTSGTRPSRPRGQARRTAMASAVEIAVEIGAFVPDREHKRLADLRKIIGASARGHIAAPNADGDDVVMVTYTYRDGVEWSPRHISACIKAAREWFRRQGVPFRYVWVAELQPGRGVLHYHAAYFVPRLHGPVQPGRGAVLARHDDGTVERALSPTFKLPLADDRGWWPHGMTRTELARDAVAYLMSYLGKEDQKDFSRFPKGARAYGVGGLTPEFRAMNRWLRAPTFVRRLSSIHDGWRRVKAGGEWVCEVTQRVIPTHGRWDLSALDAGPSLDGPTFERVTPEGERGAVLRRGGWVAPDGRHFVSEFRRAIVCGVTALQRVARHSMDGAMPEGLGPFCWLRMRNTGGTV